MVSTLFGQSIIESQALDKDTLLELFNIASGYIVLPKNNLLFNKRLAMLFYEPSTRTRFSFEAAIDDMGGRFISTESAVHFSSASKGETLEDTVRVMAGYCDGIVMRHSEDNAARRGRDFLQSLGITTPIINAGCGKGQHPTQSLTDMFTLYKSFGRVDNLDVAIVGDLKHGRTVRSLAYLLSKFPNNKIHFISPVELSINNDIASFLRRKNVEFTQSSNLDEYIETVDAVYMTRVQRERFDLDTMNLADFAKLSSEYRLTVAMARRMRPDAKILHPLPKVDEIEADVYRLPQAIFYQQADWGVPVRKALLEMVFSNV
jgi:aspartate carbamoyltransferase catalytic subunit